MTAFLRGASAVVLGVGTALAVPVAAIGAPAPCEQAENYAAQSGAQLMRLNKLDLGPVGVDGEPTTGVTLAEAKSALIAEAGVNAAAVTRMLDIADDKPPGDALVQSAPPVHPKAARRTVPASEVGPFALGDGDLRSRARWDPAMACGAAAGNVTRAEAALSRVGIGGDLVRVPGRAGSLSTTALDRGPRTVATAEVAARGFDLLDGAVHVKVARPPALRADMSTSAGGEVHYVAPVIEVSGEDIATTRLDTAGEDVELALGDDAASGSDRPDAHSGGAAGGQKAGGEKAGGAGKAADRTESATLGDLLSGRPMPPTVTKGAPLPMPTVPGVPSVAGGDPESAQVTGPGTRMRIELGTVRQATAGRSIAAKATAIKVTITQGKPPNRDKPGYGHQQPNRSGVVLDLDLGLLEAAAIAPEPRGSGVKAATAGAGGGLPITGPRLDVLALAGGGLVLAGAAAVGFGVRRRRVGS